MIPRWTKPVLIGLALITGLGLATSAYHFFSIKAKLIDVGGHRLYLNCLGEGSPTVIMDASMGSSSLAWARIQPEIAKFTRVCAYDRANTGYSDPVPPPRDIGRIIEDLHNLLNIAQVPKPYILVGHSFGGMNMRMYASKYPADVAGMVLIDSALEDLFIRWDAFVDPEAMRRKRERENAPNPEHINWEVTCAEVRATNWHTNIPLIVLSQGRPEDWSQIAPEDRETVRRMGEVRRELQEELARRSTNSRHIIAERSGHFIQDDQPDLVIDAIHQVTEAVRRNTSLTKLILRYRGEMSLSKLEYNRCCLTTHSTGARDSISFIVELFHDVVCFSPAPG